MKCNARIIYYKKPTKTGKRKVFTTLSADWDLLKFAKSLPDSVWDRLDFDAVETCNGKVVAYIGCHDEPNFGEEYSTYAELDVIFTCDACKHTQYPQLPNQYNISEWINKILDGIE
jgi:hypothetical protein